MYVLVRSVGGAWGYHEERLRAREEGFWLLKRTCAPWDFVCQGGKGRKVHIEGGRETTQVPLPSCVKYAFHRKYSKKEGKSNNEVWD